MAKQVSARTVEVQTQHGVAFQAHLKRGVLYAIGIFEGVSIARGHNESGCKMNARRLS